MHSLATWPFVMAAVILLLAAGFLVDTNLFFAFVLGGVGGILVLNFLIARLRNGIARLQAWSHRRDVKRRQSDFDETIRLNPGDAAAYRNRGDAFLDLGRHGAAIADYSEAIRLDPKFAEAYYHRLQAYFSIGRYELAQQDLVRLKELGVDTTGLQEEIDKEVRKQPVVGGI